MKIIQDLSIGDNLLCLRKRAALTQMQVIAKMQTMGSNISRTGYVKIENGYRNIKVSDLAILQTIYNVSYDEFFKGIQIRDN